MALLEYENQIFLDSFHEDGLLILAKGLGIDRIFLNFLKVYCDPGGLVLVLNTNSAEEDYFIEQLEAEDIKPIPKVVNNEYNASDRQSIYLQGGVLFVTSRILVVDLLTDRVPVEHVTGILVCKAHRIIESCQEAFILRLFRMRNKKGFIKAFSDSAFSFTTGFCQVERVMKNLFVRKLFLWPRFQANISVCLEKHKVDVVELQVQLTPAMLICQTALLDLINACIKELKRCTTFVDFDEITVENAIGKLFDQVIRFQLDPVWHQLSYKTKQLVSDLKTLRQITQHLTQYDCVTFYSLVYSIRSSERMFGQNAGWLFLDAADSLFVHAKQRVYKLPELSKKSKKENPEDQNVSDIESRDSIASLEECPKWLALSEVLKEIEEENRNADPEFGLGRVLVVAEDDRTCNQLKEVMCVGGKTFLTNLFNKLLAVKGGFIETEKTGPSNITRKKKQEKKNLESKVIGKQQSERSKELTLTQLIGESSKSESHQQHNQDKEESQEIFCSSHDAYYGVLFSPPIIIHPLHGSSNSHNLSRTLHEIQPRYVILYDADMQFVRQLEVFKASRPHYPLRAYFLMYSGSVEEQRYLTTLRKEKEAFEYLIREKATMVIPEERDGKLDDDPNLTRDPNPANVTISTRRGGAQKSTEQKIIVDMREFRSELPSLIHRRGIEIEPVTIDVGDYILTPDTCVERKSINDLIGSLNSGRLYNQCMSMCRYYKRPFLLIEFDSNKSFSLLQGKYQISNDVSIQDVTSRLSLLTLHFPRLKILWCQSPYATAELFEELKAGREQPDAFTALAVTSADDTIEWNGKYNHNPQDFLLRMPGVNSKNYRHIMDKVRDLHELTSLSLDRLIEILGNSRNARLLWDFIHSDNNQIKRTETLAAGKTLKPDYKRGGGYKRKR